jgi:Fe-S-cluster-containing dehydrogenase component/CRP-like cAMP-binding protein
MKRPKRWDVPFGPEMSEAEVARLLSIPRFRGMDQESFGRAGVPLPDVLRFDARIRRFQPAEIIVRQGDFGTSAFLVLSGAVRVVVKEGGLPASLLGRPEIKRRNPFRIIAQLWASARPPERFEAEQALSTRLGPEDEVHVVLKDLDQILGPNDTDRREEGSLFGEMAALTRMPRSATIYADKEGVELLEIRWQGLRELLYCDRTFKRDFEARYSQASLPAFFDNDPLFRLLSKEVRGELAKAAKFETYGRFDWTSGFKDVASQAGADEGIVAQEDDYPNGIVIVRAGFARICQRVGNGSRTLNYLGAGGVFALREIAHNWRKPDAPVRLHYSLRAIGYAHVLLVPTRAMEDLVLPNLPKDKILPLFPEPTHRSNGGSHRHIASTVPEETMEFLAGRRYFNGTATMLIDLDRCTRCDDCVRACAATHDNNPRFLRHGPVHGNIMVANACLHCADPVCMIDCPTGAIHREAFGGEVAINPLTCIGCKACAQNCPYDAIRMVEIRDRKGMPITAEETGQPVLKATKCDLCVEQWTGPACQRACPHGALTRMNLSKLERLTEWLER